MIRRLTDEEARDLAGADAEAGFGAIETPRGCLPLTALEVDVQIEALAAATTVRQRFRNAFDEPLEATYIFPLPPRAAVTGFRMSLEDSVVEGRIEERGKARIDYDAAIAEGRAGSIAEEERPDVFTLRVGNIPPRSSIRVEITLVAPVAIDSLEATYRFPLVVAPRYCPGVPIGGDSLGDGVAADTDVVPDASRISPPVLLPGFSSPVKLGVRVRIPGGTGAGAVDLPARNLACSLVADEHEDGDGGLTVTVVPGQRLDRDFILRWTVAADAVAITRLLVEPDESRADGLGSRRPTSQAPGDGTFTLVVVPPAPAADAPQPPRDVVFLLDRSGSMNGWKMAAARRAVARMVDTLTAADRVAVLAFDDTVERAGQATRPAPATDRHRWALLEWLAGVESRGGTELAAALRAGLDALRSRKEPVGRRPGPRTRRERVVVLVTDCQVGDEDRVIADLGARIGDATLFVVGIDTAVNEGLLSRLADATGGLAEMVESEDRLDEVIERIGGRLAAPLVSGLAIQSAGLDVVAGSLVPARLANLVPGLPLVVRGRYRGRAAGGLRVEGRRPSGDPWHVQAEATVAAAGSHGALWARGRLRHLEDLHAAGVAAPGGDDAVAQSVELSIAFGVLCRFTALVAIDPRHPERKPVATAPRRVVQAVEGPADWDAKFCGLTDSFGAAPVRQPPVDPLRMALTKVATILEQIRPLSRSIHDVTRRGVRRLLRAAVVLLGKLGRSGASRRTIESLATAYGRLYALRGDRAAVVAMLDVLADIVEPVRRVERWWHARSTGDDSDVPF